VEYILAALATFFNFAIIRWKIQHHRYEDAVLDFIVLLVLSAIFGGYGGMVVAMIASTMISLYLLAKPPTLFSGLIKDFKKAYNDDETKTPT
jgi:hypothetical protein